MTNDHAIVDIALVARATTKFNKDLLIDNAHCELLTICYLLYESRSRHT